MSEAHLVISSLTNPRVKSVSKLRKRSYRDETGLLLIEGTRELELALTAKRIPTQLFYCPDMFQGAEQAVLQACSEAGAELIECSDPVFRKMAYRDNPDGLLALAPQIRCNLNDLQLSENALVLIVETVEKPGNLGTMLRTADGAGADAVIVCDPLTDINNPNVVRASLGTIFSIPVVAASLQETADWLKLYGIQSIAATPHTDESYASVDMTGPTAIVVGTEQDGLTEAWLGLADKKACLPMNGLADSLNVAAAAAILLYEAVRQRS